MSPDQEQRHPNFSPLLGAYRWLLQGRTGTHLCPCNAYADSQGTSLDDLLMIIGNLIIGNRTMSGLAEWMEPQAPDFLQEAIEGAPAIRAATVNVLIRFNTTSPLH